MVFSSILDLFVKYHDYSYFNGTITELVDNKGIENVVFVNNIAITSTRDRIDELKTISK